MFAIFRRHGLLGEKHGNLSVMTAMSMVPIVVVLGCAVDYGRLSTAENRVQAAADAAALAVAASSLKIPASNGCGFLDAAATRAYVAKCMATANLAADLAPYVGEPRVSAPDKNGAVSVGLDLDMPTLFLRIVGIPRLKALVSASAVPSSKAHACLLALDVAGDGISLGGNSDAALDGCWLYSNAAGDRSIAVSGSATLKAESACAAGRFYGDWSKLDFTPRSNCEPLDDPLAGQAWPIATLPCMEENFTDTGKKSDRTRTYHAGTHCDIATPGNIKHVVFDPGIHVVTGTDFDVSARTVQGEGIGILLQPSVTRFDLHAQTQMTLTAMASGPMAGLVIAQEPCGPRHDDTFNGGSDLTLNGTVYLPASNVTLNGNNTSAISPVSMFIASSFAMKGTANLHLNDDFDTAGFPEFGAFTTSVRLVD